MRRWALSKLGPGDYLLPSNDSRTLWRLTAYEDGADFGAVVPYARRRFWMARSVPFPPYLVQAEVDEQPWVEQALRLPSRAAAIDYAMSREDADARS